MNILLTNDDGLDSPLLAVVQRHLASWGQVTVVAPATEQSWKGKSMSRLRELTLTELPARSVPTYSLDGTPADCANAGIYLVCDSPPDLVVSGVNIGDNLGSAFAVSSGTIGASLEANIAGIAGIAISHVLEPEVFEVWSTRQSLPADAVARCDRQVGAVLEQLKRRLRTAGHQAPVTWSVNIPQRLADHWRLVDTNLGHTTYGSVFGRLANGKLRHMRAASAQDSREDSDTATVARGDVSLTVLDLKVLGQRTAVRSS